MQTSSCTLRVFTLAKKITSSDSTQKYKPRKFPYWKIQYYEEINLSWKDVQTAYHDKTIAEKEAKNLGKSRVRLMEVGREKRVPLPELK